MGPQLIGKLHLLWFQARMDLASDIAAPTLDPAYQAALRSAAELIPAMKENLNGDKLGIFGYSYETIVNGIGSFLAPTIIKLVLELF